ncbi:MAG: TonB-dependent receptor [Melioribacteraceae bacterium]|nr:MAG: TonB-dependent receptor [Melioribacteraceae bacterium]
MFMKSLKLVVLSVLLSAMSVFGQGKISGTVTDSLSGDQLFGANIIVLGTAIGDAADIEGNYRVTNVPGGKQTLRVSYIGYKSKDITVNVVEGKTLSLDIELHQEIFESDEVVVSAQASGQVAAINQQLSSNTIVNVVSEEKIQELPDANAAEAIGRLPGVSLLRSGGEANKVILRGLSDKYTYVTVDGVKIPSTDAQARGVDLSTISQNNLAGIELYKALTPDKEADAIAGSVNLVTKSAPEGRNIRAMLRGGYNGLMSSAEQYNFSLRYSERFLENLLGVQVSGNLENNIRSNERYNLNWTTNIGPNKDDYYINDFRLRFTDEVRKRNGGNLILDYALPDGGIIKLNSSYSSTDRDYITHERNYPKEGGDAQVGGVTYSYRDREQTISTLSSALTGNNNLLDFELDWGLSYAESETEYPYDYQMNFAEPSNLGTSGMQAGIPDLKDNPELLIDYAYNNFRASSLSEAWYRTQDNFEKDKSAFLNVSRDYAFGNLFSGTVKMGGRYRTKSRNNRNTEVYSPYYLGNWKAYERLDNGSIVLKDLSGTEFDAFYQTYLDTKSPFVSLSAFIAENPDTRDLYDQYRLNPLINRDQLRAWYRLNKNGVSSSGQQLEYPENPAAEAFTYNISESVSAGYLMNTLNIGQNLIFIAGLRVEHEYNDYKNKWSPDQIGGFPVPVGSSRDTSATYSETVYLPNFQLNIKATDWMNVRLAAYKALARPDFNMRLNTYFAWDPASSSGNQQLVMGNTNLKTAKAWNFEINTSFYGNEIGLISVSAFYKEIEDMYHMLSGYPTRGNAIINSLGLDWQTLYPNNYEITIPYNSPGISKVWGFEFEHQINFAWLPGYLKHIVLSYNGSLVRSETSLIASGVDTTYTQVEILPGVFIPVPEYSTYRTSRKQPLENQPELFGNISVGYEIGGFSGRISLFHQAEYITSYSADGNSDRIINAYTRLDLSLRYQLLENLSLMCNVNNLNNIDEDNLQRNNKYNYDILRNSELYGTTVDFGVRVEM